MLEKILFLVFPTNFDFKSKMNLFNKIIYLIEVLDADCSHDHSFLCTGSADKTIMYTDVKTAKIIRKYRAHIGNKTMPNSAQQTRKTPLCSPNTKLKKN